MNEQSEQIRRIIVEQLQWDERVDESKVRVEVIHNSVRLTGTVSSFEAWRAAWRNAANVVGVAGVDNQLRIEYLPALPAMKYLEGPTGVTAFR